MNSGLFRYLSNIKELESISYTQNLLINNLTCKSRRLAQKKNIEIPPVKRATNWFFANDSIIPFLVGVIVFIGTAISFYKPFWNLLQDEYVSDSGEYFFGKHPSDRTIEAIIVTVGFGIIVTFLILVILLLIGHFCKRRKQKQYDQISQKQYEESYQKEADRIDYEIQIKNRIQKQIESVKEQNYKVQQALNQLYSLNIIHPKYRGLIPISSFCEYIETGRCTKLDGHEGAYNIYEMEIRMNLIITKLDIICSKLDEIKQNQYTLYQTLCQANNTLSRIEASNQSMMNKLDTMKENSELIEYNTRCANNTVRAMGEFLIIKELLKK